MSSFNFDNLGLGVGLRSQHFDYVLRNQLNVEWFEVITENFIDCKGKPGYVLSEISKQYPVVMHGVSLSIGSTDPLDFDYLRKVKKLARAINARWISDHICWTGVAGINTHDLLPLPFDETTLRHLVSRIKQVQDYLEQRIVLENVSSYVGYSRSSMSEWEFISRVAEEADCGLLLDVNNVYVSSFNHNFDPKEYISKLPHDRIAQFHIAGHTNCNTHLLDTHDGPVITPVWELYALAYKLTGGRSTLLEWDSKIPQFPELEAEVTKARLYQKTLSSKSQESEVKLSHNEQKKNIIPHPLSTIRAEVS